MALKERAWYAVTFSSISKLPSDLGWQPAKLLVPSRFRGVILKVRF